MLQHLVTARIGKYFSIFNLYCFLWIIIINISIPCILFYATRCYLISLTFILNLLTSSTKNEEFFCWYCGLGHISPLVIVTHGPGCRGLGLNTLPFSLCISGNSAGSGKTQNAITNNALTFKLIGKHFNSFIFISIKTHPNTRHIKSFMMKLLTERLNNK